MPALLPHPDRALLPPLGRPVLDLPLARAAAAYGALAVLLVLAGFADGRTVLGEGVWLKPARFAVSISVYLVTLAWLLAAARPARRVAALVRWGVLACMAVEMGLIGGQAARGVASHFNGATALDAAVYSVMGAAIGANTALVGVLLGAFLVGGRHLRPAERWAGALGTALFLVGSAVGGLMVQHAAHTVGAADGGAGVPGLGWSTQAGDLRAAHFVGLHALQAIPLAGLAARRVPGPERRRVALVIAAAVAYAGLFSAVLLRALSGQPLFSL